MHSTLPRTDPGSQLAPTDLPHAACACLAQRGWNFTAAAQPVHATRERMPLAAEGAS